MGAARRPLARPHPARHATPPLAPQCQQSLTLWLLVDGSLAAVTVVLAVVDIARVERLNREEEAAEAAAEEAAAFLPQGVMAGVGTMADRQRRADRAGSYACMGFCIVFFLPFVRLMWVLVGLDMLFHADPQAMALLSVESRPSGGDCNTTQFVFMFYYLQAVMWLVLGVAGVVAVAAVVGATLFVVSSWSWCARACCCRLGGGGGCSCGRCGWPASPPASAAAAPATSPPLPDKRATTATAAAPTPGGSATAGASGGGGGPATWMGSPAASATVIIGGGGSGGGSDGSSSSVVSGADGGGALVKRPVTAATYV